MEQGLLSASCTWGSQTSILGENTWRFVCAWEINFETTFLSCQLSNLLLEVQFLQKRHGALSQLRSFICRQHAAVCGSSMHSLCCVVLCYRLHPHSRQQMAVIKTGT